MSRTVRLRALRKEDAAITWKWRNEPDIRRLYAGHPYFINPEKEGAWFEKILLTDHPNVSLGVEVKETGELIAMMFLLHVNHINRSAELAFLFNPASRKASDIIVAILLTLEFGYYNLNLNRIYGKLIEEHKMLIKLYERYGGQKEGLMRQSIYKDGKYLNEVMMSILREDYETYKRREVKQQ
ncbi:MAG: GNAT family protein [bacterium]|jgi:RimJ/RimL family protein N-acetyltransferase